MKQFIYYFVNINYLNENKLFIFCYFYFIVNEKLESNNSKKSRVKHSFYKELIGSCCIAFSGFDMFMGVG